MDERLRRSLAARRHRMMQLWRGAKPNPAAVDQVAARIGVAGATLYRWEETAKTPHALFVRRWVEVIAELEVETAQAGKEQTDAEGDETPAD